MKRLILVVILVAIFVPLTVFAKCRNLEGTLVLTPDPDCTVLQFQKSGFPDVTFLADLRMPDTCFSGEVIGTLGKQELSGISYSGLTDGGLFVFSGLEKLIGPPILADDIGFFTAATVIILADEDGPGKKHLIFLRDFGFNEISQLDTAEHLVVVGGKGKFRLAKGTIRILGNEFIREMNQVSGTICTPW